jgi:hypothetical protein
VTKHPTIAKNQNCIPLTIDYEDVHKRTMKKNGKKMKVILEHIISKLHFLFIGCFVLVVD